VSVLKRKFGVFVMIELPEFPAVGIVAQTALTAEATFVFVVRFMT